MANKAFEIQNSSLRVGGVELQAGTTGVVIPGVTQAVNYFVEEIDDRDDTNPDSFGTDAEAISVIDNADYLFRTGAQTPSAGYSAAGYSVQEVDDGEIEEIYVEVAGTFLSADKAHAEAGNMWATTVPNAKDNFNASDWTQIAFRPKMRAGEIENIGSGGADTGNFVFDGSVLEMTDGSEDMTLKAPDDLYLDALGDDVFIRADDDIRLRAGVNFDEDTYDYAWSFRDDGVLSFLNDASDGEHGRITMPTDNATNERILKISGHEQLHITTKIREEDDAAHKTWKFDIDGNLTLPAAGDIKDSNGDSVLGGNTQFVAGEGISIATSGNTVTISADTNTAPQYGYFTELVHTNSNNEVDGQAVAMDSDGNSYVSYSYYDNDQDKRFGGVMKFSSTGEQLWAVNIASQNTDARYPEIRSLEYVTVDGDPALIAVGSYYNNANNKDVAFIYYINPVDGSVGAPLVDGELSANGMNVYDSVVGFDGTNIYAVVVGETYDQTLTKILTPQAGSTVDKVFFSWAEVNASGVLAGENLYYNDGVSSYGLTMNQSIASANVAGSTDPAWAGISLRVSYTEAGGYAITGVNGWGYLVNSWPVPVTLTIAGANLGGVTGVNDLTFDFDRTVFNDNSNNIQAAVSNIQGTSVGGVYCPASGGKDWSTDIGTALSFNYQLNNQAYIARFGSTAAWTKTLGASNYDRLKSVVVDSNNNVYAVGYLSNGNKGALVIKYDIDGNQQWAVYIDSANNMNNSLISVDLLSDGNLITVNEDGVVTKVNSSDGSIIWQVKADDDPSWNGDFKGTATPDGDYIITNYEDNDYTQYVMRVSGADGSSVWNKRITCTLNGNQGEIYAEDDFDAQYIDCNATYLTIAGSVQPSGGDRVGVVYSFPIDGENVDGTYGQYVISSETMNWTTESTTSTPATVTNTAMSVTVTAISPTSSASLVNSNITTIGGEPIVEPTVIEWTNPNGNVWRIEEYNGGAAVSYNGSDYDAKWFDIADHTSGSTQFRGAIIQYHAFIPSEGTIIGTIHLANDYTQEGATHTEHLSGDSTLQFVTLWDCNGERGELYFKMTNGNSKDAMIQWTAKVFYGSENNC